MATAQEVSAALTGVVYSTEQEQGERVNQSERILHCPMLFKDAGTRRMGDAPARIQTGTEPLLRIRATEIEEFSRGLKPLGLTSGASSSITEILF